ncbi:MAG TPA: decarboxylating NADP(+)-dependent phosphogluconate dehydrogenase [Patescibacteria group bacterium]|nr:decarboxylating NADP(+)-dependent phosphogluconate dehydrogenase [Patescibacteria group bacterium]
MDDGQLADIAIIGLAVMGQNIILNLNDHGYKVVAFNRTVSKVDDFINGPASGTNVIGVKSAEELVKSLKRPRKIMMMVKAGEAVDETINHILPFLEAGDILIDGGNTHYTDTVRRLTDLNKKGILYVGMGISGGEEGARFGPSIMPGGDPDAWPHIKDIFQSIAALGSDNTPCCEWVGGGGAGHYVKMVHNGIEYGDMQIISEGYSLLKQLLGLSNEEMSAIFASWNNGQLNSYLIQITADILKYKDTDGQYTIDKILDSAGQKGTGKWTIQSAAEEGQPSTVIAEALFARFTSSLKDQRIKASQIYNQQPTTSQVNKEEFINNIGSALYSSKIISYTQGFMLMKAASEKYKWNLNYGAIAQLWTGGCIIRSLFLKDIKNAFINNPNLENLLINDFFISALNTSLANWRNVISAAVSSGVPVPAMSSALAFFDSYRSEKLPANLIQAQRDYFGAHTYEIIDKPRGEFFHTNWTGQGGSTTSGSYSS